MLTCGDAADLKFIFNTPEQILSGFKDGDLRRRRDGDVRTVRPVVVRDVRAAGRRDGVRHRPDAGGPARRCRTWNRCSGSPLYTRREGCCSRMMLERTTCRASATNCRSSRRSSSSTTSTSSSRPCSTAGDWRFSRGTCSRMTSRRDRLRRALRARIHPRQRTRHRHQPRRRVQRAAAALRRRARSNTSRFRRVLSDFTLPATVGQPRQRARGRRGRSDDAKGAGPRRKATARRAHGGPEGPAVNDRAAHALAVATSRRRLGVESRREPLADPASHRSAVRPHTRHSTRRQLVRRVSRRPRIAARGGACGSMLRRVQASQQPSVSSDPGGCGGRIVGRRTARSCTAASTAAVRAFSGALHPPRLPHRSGRRRRSRVPVPRLTVPADGTVAAGPATRALTPLALEPDPATGGWIARAS